MQTTTKQYFMCLAKLQGLRKIGPLYIYAIRKISTEIGWLLPEVNQRNTSNFDSWIQPA